MPSFSETLGDRRYVSQYTTETIGFVVHKAGVPADADGNDVQVKMTNLDDTTTIFDRAATHEATGVYETALNSSETAVPGIWKVTWSYEIDGAPQTYVGLIEVGVASPDYDALEPGMKQIVESAWTRFADLFDSPFGGPHLQVYFQTRFSRGRMAQLLRIALQRLNTIAQPHMTYTLDGENGAQFPYAQWGGLLDQLLYIEAIKHLIRSYTEQPSPDGVAVARMDRRDYMQRWQDVLRMETDDATSALDVFKIAHMGLGRPRVLVSGGVYGRYAPTRMALSAVARPRYWARFY